MKRNKLLAEKDAATPQEPTAESQDAAGSQETTESSQDAELQELLQERPKPEDILPSHAEQNHDFLLERFQEQQQDLLPGLEEDMKKSEGQEHFVAWSLKHLLSSHPDDNFYVGVPENPEIQCSYAKALYHFIRPWESVPSCDPEDQIVVL